MPTHLGQELKDHVMLIAGSHAGDNECGTASFHGKALFRVDPKGNVEPNPFKVPNGRVLVVTDVEWSAYGGVNDTNDLEAERTLHLAIKIGNKPEIQKNPTVFESSLTIDGAAAGGKPGKSEYLTAGFLVAAGTRICPSVIQADPNGYAVAYLDRLMLRGYLSGAIGPKPKA